MIQDDIKTRLNSIQRSSAFHLAVLEEALLKVSRLHYPLKVEAGNVVCAECGQSRTADRPCNTVRVIAFELWVL